ncbi:MAG: hypothetical protein VKO00_02000 [Cyanobacteriota bacterium]|nr:hypothetical protein [Cyanobacteriota bacterium]
MHLGEHLTSRCPAWIGAKPLDARCLEPLATYETLSIDPKSGTLASVVVLIRSSTFLAGL